MKLRDPKLIVVLRERSRLSQRELARELQISYGHVADMERGARQPSYEVGQRMATFFEVRLDALFDEIPVEWGDPSEATA